MNVYERNLTNGRMKNGELERANMTTYGNPFIFAN